MKHANDFRAIVSAPWYRSMFPQMRISRTKNTETEVQTTLGGYRLATSVDGTLTGRGGDLIIIDDPLKSSDALSDAKREHVNECYTTTLLLRLDNKTTGAIILIMQRLHDFDLAGTLERGPEPWTILKLPAIAELDEKIQIGPDRYHIRRAGELLHAEREPREVLERYRRMLGSDTFQAQFQQEPIPPSGHMIKRHWISRYDAPGLQDWQSRVVQSWDTASKDAARTIGRYAPPGVLGPETTTCSTHSATG